MSNKIKDGGMHAKRVTGDIITYIFLIVPGFVTFHAGNPC